MVEELPVGYRFDTADELWLFVSELRGPVALALPRLTGGPERDAVRPRSSGGPDGSGGGFELGGVSLNVPPHSSDTMQRPAPWPSG